MEGAMKVTRRDALKIAAAAVPSVAAAKVPAPYPPIVTSGGVRSYPTGQLIASPDGLRPWWTAEPIYGWNLPHDDVPSALSLGGAQTLSGVVSAAIHATQANRPINAVLAVQVVVHRPDTTVRDVALPLTVDSYPFTEGDPLRSRAA